MTKRQEQANASRQKIFETAKGLIGDNGYDNVTIAQIARACGMSIGNFYHYFKSKDELVSYVERRPYEQLREELSSLQDCPLLERLHCYITRWAALLCQDFGVHFTRQWLVRNTRPAGPGEANKLDQEARAIEGFLQQAVPRGELAENAPIRELAQMITFSLFGSMTYYCMTDGAFDILAWAEGYCALVETSLLAPYLPRRA